MEDAQLELYTSNHFIAEKKYLLMILKSFIGIDTTLVLDKTLQNQYFFKCGIDKKLIFLDSFFSKQEDNTEYITVENIPKNISFLSNEYTQFRQLPILFGSADLTINQQEITCGLDILSSIFFMLSRWEEIANTKRDIHGRFEAIDSVAYKENFLLRPIVNEYCDYLYELLKMIGYTEKKLAKQFTIRYTCDVDIVRDKPSFNKIRLLSRLIRTVKQEKEYTLPKIKTYVYNHLKKINANDSFVYIFKKLHQFNVDGSFYFITDHTSNMDADYTFGTEEILALIKKINSNDFNVGIHPSYNTFKDLQQTKKEFQKLKEATDKLGITQMEWGGRQHFLRWEPKTTHWNWEHMGADYDSTLGYADSVGFRSGTCYDYQIFDPIKRQVLNLVERPLMLMNVTLVSPKYMNKGYSNEAFDLVTALKEECKKHNGYFNFLWHNSHFLLAEDKSLFEHCLYKN